MEVAKILIHMFHEVLKSLHHIFYMYMHFSKLITKSGAHFHLEALMVEIQGTLYPHESDPQGRPVTLMYTG